MIIGFTGTQTQLPAHQARELGYLIGDLLLDEPVTEAHHGDCVGADAAFDAVCAMLAIERHSHPGPLDAKRAHCEAEVIHPPRPFLDRNRVIVDTCDLLVACPRGPEQLRSGTWATIRYARKIGRRVVIIWPDGTKTGTADECPAGGDHVWTDDVGEQHAHIPRVYRWHCDNCNATLRRVSE